jgi:hypothetical protein
MQQQRRDAMLLRLIVFSALLYGIACITADPVLARAVLRTTQEHPGILVEGTVRLADGTPVKSGSISFDQVGFDVKDGKFFCQTDRVMPGDYTVTFINDNLGMIVTRPLHIDPEQQTANIDVRVGTGKQVKGKVITPNLPDGAPGARIEVRREIPAADAPPSYPDWSIRTNREGIFLLDGEAFEGGYMRAVLPYYKPSEWVQIKPPFPMQMTLNLKPQTMIMGQVEEGDTWNGQPVKDAKISFTSKDFRTGASADEWGHFAVTDLKPGDYIIDVYAPYYLNPEQTFHVEDGQQAIGLRITLEREKIGILYGRVVASDGKTGIEGAKVTFEQAILPMPFDRKSTKGSINYVGPGDELKYTETTAAGGYFDMEIPMTPGTKRQWSVQVEKEGHFTNRYMARFSSQDELRDITLQLFHSGRLQGKVELPKGLPAKVYHVELYAWTPIIGSKEIGGGRGWTADIAPETGEFKFDAAPPGEHWLMMFDIPGWQQRREKVTVKEGETTEINISAPQEK